MRGDYFFLAEHPDSLLTYIQNFMRSLLTLAYGPVEKQFGIAYIWEEISHRLGCSKRRGDKNIYIYIRWCQEFNKRFINKVPECGSIVTVTYFLAYSFLP